MYDAGSDHGRYSLKGENDKGMRDKPRLIGNRDVVLELNRSSKSLAVRTRIDPYIQSARSAGASEGEIAGISLMS